MRKKRDRERESACRVAVYYLQFIVVAIFSCCLLSIVRLFMLLTCAFCVCVKLQVRRFRELPLTATHIYNRTENKTTAVTYKVSISIHQY